MDDYDKVYIQEVIPRVAWVKPLEYEVNVSQNVLQPKNQIQIISHPTVTQDFIFLY